MRASGTRPDRRSRTVVLSLLALAGWALLSGCGTTNPYPTGSYDRGVFFRDRGNHLQAVHELETFVRQNPTDSLAAQAQYLKALSYLELKEYPLAIVELQILRKDYPTSALIAESYFQEGVAQFQQVGRVERDISGVYKARERFDHYVLAYPDAPHAGEARQYLLKISDIIVQKQLNAAEVFRHIGQLDAVTMVLENVLKAEPSSGLTDMVLLRLGKNYEKLREPEKAAEVYQRLVTEFPDSHLRRQAERGLDRVNKRLES